MVYDSEKGCVRDITDEPTPSSRRIEDELFLWQDALPQPKHTPLQSDLSKIYGEAITNGHPIVELEKQEHLVFPGFTRYGIKPNDLVELHRTMPIRKDLAYRCGYEKIIYAGRPEIKESPERQGSIDFNCGMCKGTMYSEEIQPNLRVC